VQWVEHKGIGLQMIFVGNSLRSMKKLNCKEIEQENRRRRAEKSDKMERAWAVWSTVGPAHLLVAEDEDRGGWDVTTRF